MINIVIFCSGDHAKVVFSEIIKLKKYKILGFVDNFKKKGTLIIKHLNKNYYTIGSISSIITKKNNFRGIIASGLNFKREKIYNDIIELNNKFKFEKIISKNSVINSNVLIGNGTLVVSGVVINCGSKIGSHCIINTSSSIDHDNIFDDFSSVGPGVITGGNVKLGKNSFIGIGSVVNHNIKIKDETVIGSKSLVNKNCQKNSLYYGVPIKRIGSRKKFDTYL
jgi:sugar O-acyltransferase (sialic acid O-acetyltransferase NeuD family)